MNTELDEVGAATPHDDRVPNHECYRHVRRNVTELLTEARPSADSAVPACPKWTLRGLLTHLVGVAATAIGRLPGGLSDRRVPVRRTWTSRSCWRSGNSWARRWTCCSPTPGGKHGNILVMDAFTHELDIRYAIGAELPAAHPAFAGAFAVLARGFATAVHEHRLPALRLSSGSTQWTVGDGVPAATLTRDPLRPVPVAGRAPQPPPDHRPGLGPGLAPVATGFHLGPVHAARRSRRARRSRPARPAGLTPPRTRGRTPPPRRRTDSAAASAVVARAHHQRDQLALEAAVRVARLDQVTAELQRDLAVHREPHVVRHQRRVLVARNRPARDAARRALDDADQVEPAVLAVGLGELEAGERRGRRTSPSTGARSSTAVCAVHAGRAAPGPRPGRRTARLRSNAAASLPKPSCTISRTRPLMLPK